MIAYRCLNDDGWTMQYMSPGVELLAGYRPEVFLAPRGRGYVEIIHAEDRAQVRRGVEQALQAGTGFVLDYRIVAADGTVRFVHEYGTALRGDDGAVVALQGFVAAAGVANRMPGPLPALLDHDRLHRALRIMKECHERLVRAGDEAAFLSGLCRMMVDTAGYAAASIAVAGPVAPQVRQYDASCAHDTAPPSVHAHLCRDADDGQAQGPAARAMQDGRPAVCADIARDALPAATRAQLLERGYRSAIWLPLNHGKQCLGVMTIYSGTPRVFDAVETQLMQTLADNAALGIHAVRSQDQRKRIELAALKIVAGVSASTGDDFFSQFASNMALAVGADGAFVARFKDDGLEAAETVAAVVDNALVPNFDYAVEGSPCERLVKMA